MRLVGSDPRDNVVPGITTLTIGIVTWTSVMIEVTRWTLVDGVPSIELRIDGIEIGMGIGIIVGTETPERQMLVAVADGDCTVMPVLSMGQQWS